MIRLHQLAVAAVAATALAGTLVGSPTPAEARGFHVRWHGHHHHWRPRAYWGFYRPAYLYGGCVLVRRPVRDFDGTVLGFRPVRVCG